MPAAKAGMIYKYRLLIIKHGKYMKYAVQICVRPKTNSSYTAKKIVNIANIKCPETPIIKNMASSDDEFLKVTKDNINDICDEVKDVFIDKVSKCDILKNTGIPEGLNSASKSEQNDSLLEMTMAYIASSKIVDSYKNLSRDLTDDITAIELLNIAAGLYDGNMHIEVLFSVKPMNNLF